MRILFFSHYYPPENNAPAVRTAAHCRIWAALGHDVTVITCAPNHPTGEIFPGYRNRLLHRETVDDVSIVRVFTLLAPNAGTVRRIVNYLSYMVSAVLASVLVRRPDIIIATTPQFFCGWAGVFARFIHRRPLVLEVRDLWPESIVAVGAITNRRIISILERLERWMYRAASRIVTVGRGYRDQLILRGVPKDKIEVIYNGADPELVDAGPAESSAPSLPAHISFVCTYVGTVGMAHGLEIVLDAASLLAAEGRTEIGFMIVGDGA
ncbi:MAG: glycosyltransferase family 4 protein, partial [Bdellovibrionales bacterium]|nr:glycosyltransferase family 4 protein [Bdellovibrionales bacterium]